MRRFWLGLGVIVVVLTLAMTLTIPTRLGFSLWHHNAGFVFAFVAAGAVWPLWGKRRFASMTLAVSGSLATVSGFAMLYTKDFPFKEWLTWWHVWTSFVFTLAFLVHWFHNNPRLAGFTARLLRRDRLVGFPAAGAWLVLLGLGAWTAAPGVRALFTRESYLHLASWAVFAGVAFAYGLWLAFRAPRLRAFLARAEPRNRARALVDTSLFLANAGALLTGFALLYFAEPLRAGEFKYVSKWWHTATSVALLAFVAFHVGFNARLLAAHARQLDGRN